MRIRSVRPSSAPHPADDEPVTGARRITRLEPRPAKQTVEMKEVAPELLALARGEDRIETRRPPGRVTREEVSIASSRDPRREED